jgi:hypothetical protein
MSERQNLRGFYILTNIIALIGSRRPPFEVSETDWGAGQKKEMISLKKRIVL